MARGQSPYQGRYTVPIADFSGIERAGAAWGEAFKDVGKSIGGAIEKYQLNKQKDAVLTADLDGKIDAIRVENPEMWARLQADEEGGKYLKNLQDGELSLKGKEQFSGYLTGLTGETTQQLKSQIDRANATAATATAVIQEGIVNYNLQGKADADELFASLDTKTKKKEEAWINEQVDTNLLSRADAKEQWDSTQLPKVNKELLGNLSVPDKALIAQSNLFKHMAAVPLDDAGRTKLVSDVGNLTREYELAQARRKARPVAEVVKDETEAAKRKREGEELKLRQQHQALETGAQALEIGDLDLQEKQEVLNALPEKQRQEQVERENRNILSSLEIKKDKKAAKALKASVKEFPQGQLIARQVGDTTVYLMNTGQTIQVIDTGALTESQRLKMLQDTMGPKLLEYFNETRHDDTGLINDPEDMNDMMEKALHEVFGFEPIFDEGKEMPTFIKYWKLDKKTKKYKPADAPAATPNPKDDPLGLK